jgi:hypothetical protein
VDEQWVPIADSSDVDSLELSEDGKAMKFYEVTPFAIRLTPETIAAAASTLSPEEPG